MTMKKRLCIVGVLLLVGSMISMITYISIQDKIIKSYETGFEPTGTFEYIDYETDNLNKQEYIVLEAKQEKIICYSYKQFGDLEKSVYKTTTIPNLLIEANSDRNSRMICLGDDILYYISESDIVQYDKISDIGVFINTDK